MATAPFGPSNFGTLGLSWRWPVLARFWLRSPRGGFCFSRRRPIPAPPHRVIYKQSLQQGLPSRVLQQKSAQKASDTICERVNGVKIATVCEKRVPGSETVSSRRVRESQCCKKATVGQERGEGLNGTLRESQCCKKSDRGLETRRVIKYRVRGGRCCGGAAGGEKRGEGSNGTMRNKTNAAKKRPEAKNAAMGQTAP